MTKRKF